VDYFVIDSKERLLEVGDKKYLKIFCSYIIFCIKCLLQIQTCALCLKIAHQQGLLEFKTVDFTFGKMHPFNLLLILPKETNLNLILVI
jgi:hypothetical protein